MGLSSLPSPSEGIFSIIMVNTVQSISILKSILCFLFQIMGIHFPSSTSSESNQTPLDNSNDIHLNPSDTFVEELRRRIPAIRFSSVINKNNRSEHEDCTVCLTQYEPDSEINQLVCGHYFHKVCLEKWLDYWNITCPLCRTPLIPEHEENVEEFDFPVVVGFE